MKYINLFFCAMMILFIVVQYNDPDGPMWAVIYSVPAVWAGLAAFRLQHLFGPRSMVLLGASLLAAFALTAYYWPTTENFWVTEVYWETETAREGMGMMIATFVLVVAAATIWFAKRKRELT